MKKYALLLKFASMTFLLGVSSVFVWVSLRSSETLSPAIRSEASLSADPPTEIATSEMPELSFCELIKHPEDFDGKLIRLSGVLEWTQHGLLFAGDCASPYGTMTWVKTTSEQWDEIDRALASKAYRNKASIAALNMRATGRFAKNVRVPDSNGLIMSSDSHEHQAPYRFELIKIEKIGRAQRKYDLPAAPVLDRKNRASVKK